MAALFPRWSNTFAKLAIVFLLLLIVGGPVGAMLYVRTPWITGQYYEVPQPLEFDHRHHIRDDAIDCRYCHFSVETSPSAGMPPVEVCMSCHNQIWNNSPLLDPLREAYFTGRPLAWQRVHNLPEFVYFDHSIHVNKGVGCESCHGRVDRMAYVYQQAPMSMEWCLDCHRSPQEHLRPRSEITTMGYRPQGNPHQAGKRLAEEYSVRSLVHCSACHR